MQRKRLLACADGKDIRDMGVVKEPSWQKDGAKVVLRRGRGFVRVRWIATARR